MSNVAEAAYLAGFVDGEGHINISNWNQYYELRFRVTNSNLEVLRELQRVWGGNIIIRKREQENHKQLYDLRWSPSEIDVILPKIQPYLKVKKEHCAIALRFRSTKQPVNSKRKRLTEEEIQTRIECRGYLLVLNKRGNENE